MEVDREVIQLLADDFFAKVRNTRLPKFNYKIVLVMLVMFSLGLAWAWLVDPVEWDYSNIEPTPISSTSQEVIVLGLASLAFQTGNADSPLIARTLSELNITASNVCNARKYTSFDLELDYLISAYGVTCD